MPLTKKGKGLKHAFSLEYGKRKGEQVFYAYENKHKHDGIGMGIFKKR